jgi:hypothetical protein
MTGAFPEDDEHIAEIAKTNLLLRKPFLPKELVEFIDSHLAEDRLPVLERAAIL